jgi:hypothetical protein
MNGYVRSHMIPNPETSIDVTVNNMHWNIRLPSMNSKSKIVPPLGIDRGGAYTALEVLEAEVQPLALPIEFLKKQA